MDQKDKAKAFLNMCAAGEVEKAYDQYVASDFIHHNPYFAGGAHSLRQAMKENAGKFPHKVFEVLRCAEEQDLVFVHSKITMNKGHAGIAVVHIFRFRDGLIAELWDVGQPVPENSVNEHGMF